MPYDSEFGDFSFYVLSMTIFSSSCAVYHDMESKFKRTTLRMKKQNKGNSHTINHICVITELCAQYVRAYPVCFAVWFFSCKRICFHIHPSHFQVQNLVACYCAHFGSDFERNDLWFCDCVHHLWRQSVLHVNSAKMAVIKNVVISNYQDNVSDFPSRLVWATMDLMISDIRAEIMMFVFEIEDLSHIRAELRTPSPRLTSDT